MAEKLVASKKQVESLTKIRVKVFLYDLLFIMIKYWMFWLSKMLYKNEWKWNIHQFFPHLRN